MSHVNPDHDGRKACSICWQFSYFSRVSQSQRNKHHTSEHLKDIIAKSARQFIGNRQQDPAEYLEQIMNQCSEFKQLTSHQSIQNFTCISCNTKTQTLDDRNVLIQPPRKEDETLDLNQILSKPKVSSCNKNCEKCGLDKQHEVNEELLICPPVLIINLQRFKTEQRVNFYGRRKSLRLINNSQFQVDNVVSYEKNCQDVDPSPLLLLKETVYSLK